MGVNYNRNVECYYKSARELFLPIQDVSEIEGFVIRLGKKTYHFRGGHTPWNNYCSVMLAENKYCTNKLLQQAGVPVPKATAIHIDDFKQGKLRNIIADLTFPLVIKPTSGAFGEDVLCNIPDYEELHRLTGKVFAGKKHNFISIEEFHGRLKSFRILVFNNRIIGVLERYPARVTGDGQHTIIELVALANRQRKQISDTLGPIVIDEECHIRLRELNITPQYIPKQDECIVLCYTCNASRGGSYEAISNKMCRENRRLFIKTAAVMNLTLAGIDVECEDLGVPVEQSNGVIIEVNGTPSVRIHESPMHGKPARVSKPIVRALLYRHPIYYLYVLYTNKRTAFYIRSVILLPILAAIYRLLI
ncbi:UDP-N-acetylmuramyl peptide synthase [Legionella spiritensis]|uniref:UDP-N-acetylmuramyl peptide synthase n=1 Tax=Legionella spiritensis TaxID=452 RepID=UPI000F6DCE24|nr:UDP-N-acetylmuramyl peptide synthase [Legionella spiritensis]VEG92056.1 UDP-N-acetylmuramyl tripeptide synthase [Legionella spiritensis]